MASLASGSWMWPGLAPHETESSPGRYAYDEKNKVWRRRDVSHGLGNTPNAKGWQNRIVDWIDSIGF